MESRLKDKGRGYNAPVVVPELKAVGKRSAEWDLNDWKWDGDLFTAAPTNSVQADCRSRQLFPTMQSNLVSSGLSNTSSLCDVTLVQEKDEREPEKRRRVEGDMIEMGDEVGALSLNLGNQAYPIADAEKGFGKRTKIVESTPTRAVCQVEGCRADLSNAKDYHRRHKVCEAHSKASDSLVGNVMQRFCQQCSRFHVLQEFDEGKRSCRRRLAGHNRRRRKTHPDTTTANVGSLSEESSSSYLLISLLRILSNMHPSSVDQTKDQDLLSHLLRNLVSTNGQNLSGIQQETKSPGISPGTAERTPDAPRNRPDSAKALGSTSKVNDHSNVNNSTGQCLACRVSNAIQRTLHIDLNSVYDESQECMEKKEWNEVPGVSGSGPLSLPTSANQATQKSSPPVTSSISNSTSSQSPSSSSEEAQSRTDRIVFKLFGKDPSDLPLVLRTQILDWLSQSPTDIESHIRPGCIIMTIYLRLENSKWEELLSNLGFSLRRLLDASEEPFWAMGWIYVRVQQSVAFISNGQVVIETPLPATKDRSCKITSIKPIAVTECGNTQFLVKGFNICRSTTRLLCVLEGNYLAQESCYDLMGGGEPYNDQDKLHSLSFSCLIPKTSGRGFIEVGDHGLSGSFFPFIVADEEVCSQIRALEDIIEVDENSTDISEETQKAEARNQALDFLNEMGWLLHRSSQLKDLKYNLGFFPFKRFKWLMEFSMEHEWCAVMRKLLGMLFDGVVEAGEYPSVHLALLDTGLLHRAVQKGSQRMVEFLLWYAPQEVLVEPTSEWKENTKKEHQSSIFYPDAAGPGGLTPLHLVASRDGFEHILDALTSDPKSIGIQAWNSASDNSGLTPKDYACLRKYSSYINLVQRKINAASQKEHMIVDIPANPKQRDHKSGNSSSLRIEKSECRSHQGPCRLCEQKRAYGATRTALSYRPAVLSLVAIAAVCVCAALLFKSSPKVLYVFQPFRWEHLKYGSI